MIVLCHVYKFDFCSKKGIVPPLKVFYLKITYAPAKYCIQIVFMAKTENGVCFFFF